MKDGLHTKKIEKASEEPAVVKEDFRMYAHKPIKRAVTQQPSTSNPVMHSSAKTITLDVNGKSITLPTIEFVMNISRANQDLTRKVEQLVNELNAAKRLIQNLQKQRNTNWPD